LAQQYTDAMIDCETTSTRPDRGAMIQLSAVKFNLETHDVSLDMFNRCLHMPAWRSWDDSTYNWWVNDKRETLEKIMLAMEEPAKVMEDFVDWAAPTGHLRFWSKPLSFDWPFVAGYCADFNQPMPFDFRQANDMRAFMRGKCWPEPFKEPQLTFKGIPHNALHDVLHQIRVLFSFMEYGNGYVEQEKTDVVLQEAHS